MSTVITDNLTGKTAVGNVTITSEGGAATMQLQQGLVKAWNNTDSAGTTINDSFNISSLSDIGAGRQGHSVTNLFNNSNHAPTFSVDVNYNQMWTWNLATTGWNTALYTGSAYVDGAVRTPSSGDLA
jgi:hypothetical protein